MFIPKEGFLITFSGSIRCRKLSSTHLKGNAWNLSVLYQWNILCGGNMYILMLLSSSFQLTGVFGKKTPMVDLMIPPDSEPGPQPALHLSADLNPTSFLAWTVSFYSRSLCQSGSVSGHISCSLSPSSLKIRLRLHSFLSTDGFLNSSHLP